MTDTLEVNAAPEETTTDEVVKTDRKFNQDEVNRLIKDRVKREKDDYAELKQTYDNAVKEYEEKLIAYQNKLNSIIETQMQDLPIPVKKLLDKLDPLEKLDWLNEPDNRIMQVERKTVPSTPKANTTTDKAVVEQKSKSNQYSLF
jgi:hypothetical protein